MSVAPARRAAPVAGLFEGRRDADPTRQDLLRRVRRHDADFTVCVPDQLGIVLTLTEAHRVERWTEGRRSAEPPRVGSTTLIPPGQPTRFVMTGPARVLMLRLHWPALAGWLAEDHGVDPARIAFQPRLHADDPLLARLLYGLARADDADPVALRRAIAARLLAGHAERPRPELVDAARGGVPAARLRRVLDRVEADLPGPVDTAALAAEAGMSPFHFAREFRRSTGSSPHQHVIRRRVERAMLLLADRKTSAAEVAQATGFTHSSHLARHMRRLTGLSPASFRAAVLP